jgi:hypothetical protein
MSITHKEASQLFDQYLEAQKKLVEFFGTDDKGRLNLELFIKVQAAQLEARVGLYTPKGEK